MALRNRNGIWHYRFKIDGKEYAETTGLVATARNKTAANQIEAERRREVLEGRVLPRRVKNLPFNEAAEQFLEWAKIEHEKHPNTWKRVETSFASLGVFFDRQPVSQIDEGRIERYKVHRVQVHQVRDITLRHDLHALSKFFGYAVKQRWCRENPLRSGHIRIPSDADAVRIHVITASEEELYFQCAARNRDLYDLTRLMINQGPRPEEVLSLPKVVPHTNVCMVSGNGRSAMQ